MLVFLLLQALGWRTVMFQHSGFYCIPGPSHVFFLGFLGSFPKPKNGSKHKTTPWKGSGNTPKPTLSLVILDLTCNRSK